MNQGKGDGFYSIIENLALCARILYLQTSLNSLLVEWFIR